MKDKNVVRNYIYNILYQFLVVGLPLLTIPYLSRVLGPEILGVNGFVGSVSNFFVVFAVFGISIYGSREIAYRRDDKQALSEAFWGIFFTRTISVFLSLVLYFLFIILFNVEYTIIFYIYALSILTVAFDVSWLLIGLEEFKKTVTRNALVRIAAAVLIFLLVKDKDDLILYILINLVANLIGNMALWIYVPKIINSFSMNNKAIKQHFISSFFILIPQLIIQVYSQLDRYFLATFSTISEVGLYDQAQRLLLTILAFITSLSTVLSPRIAHAYSTGDLGSVKYYLNKTMIYCFYSCFPIIFGIIAISNSMPRWFFGEKFKGIEKVLVTMSPMLLFISIGTIIGTQLLIQIGKQNIYTWGISMGALASIILNLLLDKNFGAVGASTAKVIAEITVTICFFFFSIRYFELNALIQAFLKYFGVSLVMLLLVFPIGMVMESTIITTIIQCVVGCIIYVGVLFLFKDNLQNEILNMVLGKFLKKNKANSE